MVSTLQITSQELFDEWVSKLRHHRLYRQNEIAMYPNDKSFYFPHYPSPSSPAMTDSASIRKVDLWTSQHAVNENYVFSRDSENAFSYLSAHESYYL